MIVQAEAAGGSEGPRAMAQLRTVVSRPIGFDAVLRVRCSAGIRACDFIGNFVATNSNDLEMAAIDSDKTLIAEIK